VARGRTQRAATVGVVEHGNSAVLVTVAPDGVLLDRRRIDLTDRGLPTHPHHHEGSWAVGRYLSTPGARKLSLADEERIADNRAQTVADFVMYREALAAAAEARGWSVHWYDRERVARAAAAALGRDDVAAFLNAMGRSIGPPWQAKQKLAAAAAFAATRRRASRPTAG
jgi:hypothetical protein